MLASRSTTSFLVLILASAVLYGTPLLFAALGELLAERSGVLNLGVEGMMLVGRGDGVLGGAAPGRGRRRLAGRGARRGGARGRAMALIHAFLVITLRANQIVSGLALTIFAGAAGLSSYLGNDLEPERTSRRDHAFTALDVLGLGEPARRRPDPLRPVRARLPVVAASSSVGVYLARTRPGLNVRAVGESPAAADAMGIDVTAYRYLHTLAGGALAGDRRRVLQPPDHAAVGRRHHRRRRVDRGRARDLRVLARRTSVSSARTSSAPSRRCRSLCRHAGGSAGVPAEVFKSLPYVMTIVVLVAVSSGAAKRRLGAPAALGIPYVREER